MFLGHVSLVGRLRPLAVITAGLWLAFAAVIPAAAQAQKPSANDIDEVTVTGSRIRRADLETASPIAVIGDADYVLSGATNVEQLLNTMPEVVPSEGQFTNNDSSGTAQIDLRGLGPQRSMILVNGRRWLFFDSRQIADLNTIPVALVAGTELVTGGSSAVYGSDAVAGVVNFILKDNFEGLDIALHHDVSGKSDGEMYSADLTMGGNFADGRGNAVVYVNRLDRKPVLADAREQSKFFYVDAVNANGQPELRPGGSAGIPNGRFAGIPTGAALAARPGVQSALAALGLSGITGLGFKLDETGKVPSIYRSPDDEYNFNPLNYLQLPQERTMVGGLASYSLTDNIKAYSEILFTQNQVDIKRAPTPVSGTYEIQVNSPFLTTGLQNLLRALDDSETTAATRSNGYTPLSVGRRIGESRSRDVYNERNAYRWVAGIRGDLGDVGPFRDADFDVYFLNGRTRNVVNSFGNILSAAFAQGVTTRFDATGKLVCTNPANGCVPLNIFGPKIDAAGLAFISSSSTSSEEAELSVAQASATSKVGSLPGGPVGLAAGVEWREVSGRFFPSQGGVGDINQGPTGGSYDVLEFFGEALLPLTESIELSAAVRHSDYSLERVGSSLTYGGGLSWTVHPSIKLRGQYQRAVRAPSVSELYSAQSTNAPASVDPCSRPTARTNTVIRNLCIATGVPADLVGDAGVQPSFQITGIIGGNPDLDEEKTDTYTAGLVLTPQFAPSLSVTVDYFRITIDDAIAQLGGSVNNVLDLCYNQIQNANSQFCQAVIRQPGGIITSPGGVKVLNANVGAFKTDGVDLRVNYDMDLGFGLLGDTSNLALAFGGTWLNSFDRTPVAELPDRVNKCAGSFGLTCGEPLPEFKATSRVTWSDGPLSLSLRWRFLGSLTDDKITNGGIAASTLPVPKIGTVNYFDLTGRYSFGESYEVVFGVTNVFDRIQPILGSSQEQLNTFPSTYDPFGRKLFLSFTGKYRAGR